MSNKKIRLVIVGGGFAGIKVARAMRHQRQFEITLISDDPNFRYYPALYRSATGYRIKESVMSLEELLSDCHNVEFHREKITKIDRGKKQLRTKSGLSFSYDYCVLALGVVTNYFGIKGIEEHSFTIKSLAGIKRLRKHLHEEIIEDKELDSNYVVVGAGPTGVELSAALRSYLTTIAKLHRLKRTKVNLDLIEAAPRVLPMLSPNASKRVGKRLRKLGVRVMTGKTVQAETDQTLIVNNSRIPTQTVVWTAGVSNNPFFSDNSDEFTLNEKHKVEVSPYLQVDPHTFVIGDNAATPYSGLAETAIHNALYVIDFLKRAANGKSPKPYRPFKPITIIPVGPSWSILQWRSLVLTGRVPAVLRVAADFVGYADVMGVRRAFRLWMDREQKEEYCPSCKRQLVSDH